ncbi:restriction endonuclease subunit S [Escherichia coli]|uniref:restriction endonuclease subunit S n=1 Tax=Escherichia coli TaxID=562 RepID=UPI0010226991|nr:restriction endonuclease subunit S [Escherichia coli]EEW1184588.1 restriction endonuclease subunit S [Escherichia coli]EFH1082329.1 restriction endonuclease subunit S [Escherichia coli]EFH5677412.1 restriction endonuclease subunit S [Escherichia coli]EHE9922719.1 restriction endonuclease subunit S [Escherichia coli]EHK5533152.1 restriction endonuclease subunit S [Escherichia coli]
MSEMSYLEKLLDGVEVEWLPLAKVCRLINGRAYKQEELLSKGKYPVLRVGNFFTNQNWYYSDLELDQDKYCDNGDLLYAWSASFGPRIWHGGKSIYHYHIWKVVPDSNLICKQFLYYLLQWDTKALKDAHSTGSTMMHISKTTIEKRLVPIPCPDNPEKSLAIQSEIVRILDKFTAVTAELTAELTMRKKQYNYYRDQLLSFKEGEVEWKSLEDIALFRRGSFPQPYGNSEWYDGEGCMPFVQVADVADSGFTLHTKTKQQISKIAQSKSVFVEAGTIVVTLQGTIGRVAITQYDCYVDRTLAIFTNFKVKINKKYFAYQLKAKFDSEKEFARGSTLKTITKEEFSKFQLPIPSINEQNRIVSLLDKFDTLAHSIKQGLPREIELRQKQYEYYRDLLFSFPKPETVSN